MTQVSSGETEAVTKKPETTNEHEKPREKKERVRPPTKVVIRRLPPSLTKDAFVNQISPLPEYDYFYFVRPDKSLGPFAFSRAYINFTKQEDIFTFKEQFDNYTFLDKKGNEFPAVVEFAPFQRLPKKRLGRKRDPKMGTLEEDPAYISFLESKATKPTETGSTQHCSLEYFPPPEKKKITTTPLLDFVRQRRAERQRMRDERREERRRKEQERKRLKDADRDRRRGTVKPDTGSSRETASDSVLRVLRNPEHEKEVKDDSGRGGGSKEGRDKVPQPGTKKREEQQRTNRNKDHEWKEKPFQETRQRENKGQSSIKSYRDDRQKQMEIRAQRRLPDDQRRKTSFERGQGHVKMIGSHQSLESEKGQGSSKTSDTRRSQEFDHSSTKSSDTHRSQEFERNQGSSRTNDLHRHQEYDRQTHSNRDMEHRKHYQSSDLRKTPNERFQSHVKDSEKPSKDSERRKSYRDSESKRIQGYARDVDQKKHFYNVKTSRNYNEADSKKTSSDHRIHFKDSDQKVIKEPLEENVKAQKQDESKKWEQMGAKPKRKISPDTMNKPESKSDRAKEQTLNTEKPVNEDPDRINSLDPADQKDDPENKMEEKQETLKKGTESDSEEQTQQRRSLESEKKFTTENTGKNKQESLTPESAESEDKARAEVSGEYKENTILRTGHKYGAKPSRRRGSLDSSDHESEVQGNKGMSRSATGSDWSVGSKLKRNHSLELDMDAGQRDDILKGSVLLEKSSKERRKDEDKDDKDRSTDASGNGTDGEHKRDPRVERRIRNKDRPSIEIYRPGMGRFSLQRKERERGPGSAPGTAGSSMEQESPSGSPSPTPTNSARITTSTKTTKGGNELRSMTFKRSVSREK